MHHRLGDDMLRSFPRFFAMSGLALLAIMAWRGSAVRSADADPKGTEFFESKIRPVLVTQCYECHSTKASKVKGGLLLDSRDGLRAGGDSGAVVVPGKPGDSLLLKSLRHDGKLKMPPKSALPAQVVADFEQWIAMGAPDPRVGGGSAYKRLSLEEARTFWSLVPVQDPPAPKTADAAWPRSDADRFILARLEQNGLRPVGDADRATLLRRLSFDLTGLPPTPEEVDAFVRDADPKAAEKVVDRLLASPAFGERWGRYWLDLAHYAESNGNADNTPFPEAWRYRDYVIKSLNDDKPYDRFIREQVAGDLLSPAAAESPTARDELRIATGFLAMTSKPRAQNNPDYKYDLIADQIDVTSRVVLSLSVMCARCHDHKFDPISTKEYYALAGIFDSSQMLFGKAVAKGGKNGVPTGMHALSSGGEAMGLREGTARNCQVCIGGDSSKLGESVPRGFLKVATLSQAPAIKSGSGRLELAEWLTSRDNPLTARVAVNRIWLHLFGRGIVPSADNFGFLGERPSHPELLDHLATRFMKDGWSVKKLIRYLALSRTYQLAGAHDAVSYQKDPDNRLGWRMSQRRLDAEAFRDATLAISGQLNLTPPKGSNAIQSGGKGKTVSSKETNHRSVYLGIIRGAPLPESLSTFDVANPNVIVAQREETTVPSQALYLLNSPFVVEQSRATTRRLLARDSDDAERLDLAYRMFYARPATAREKDHALKYLTETAADLGGKRSDAWASLCQVLIASAEFRYLR
jgi:cytochrome c553